MYIGHVIHANETCHTYTHTLKYRKSEIVQKERAIQHRKSEKERASERARERESERDKKREEKREKKTEQKRRGEKP